MAALLGLTVNCGGHRSELSEMQKTGILRATLRMTGFCGGAKGPDRHATEQRGCASRIQSPAPHAPHYIFSRSPDRLRGREKMFSSFSLRAGRSIGRGIMRAARAQAGPIAGNDRRGGSAARGAGDAALNIRAGFIQNSVVGQFSRAGEQSGASPTSRPSGLACAAPSFWSLRRGLPFFRASIHVVFMRVIN